MMAASALPDHPVSIRWRKCVQGAAALDQRVFQVGKRQPNPQVGETVLLKVTIDPGAAVGDRETADLVRRGADESDVFSGGTLPEICEREPNDWMRPNQAC